MSSRKVCHACVSMSRDFLCGVCDAPSEDVRAVVDEPVAYMTRCIKGDRKGVVEEVAGPDDVNNLEYWSPSFPVYARPQRPLVMPNNAQILEAMRKPIYNADGGYVWDYEKDRILEAGKAVLDLLAELNK